MKGWKKKTSWEEREFEGWRWVLWIVLVILWGSIIVITGILLFGRVEQGVWRLEGWGLVGFFLWGWCLMDAVLTWVTCKLFGRCV